MPRGVCRGERHDGRTLRPTTTGAPVGTVFSWKIQDMRKQRPPTNPTIHQPWLKRTLESRFRRYLQKISKVPKVPLCLRDGLFACGTPFSLTPASSISGRLDVCKPVLSRQWRTRRVDLLQFRSLDDGLGRLAKPGRVASLPGSPGLENCFSCLLQAILFLALGSCYREKAK